MDKKQITIFNDILDKFHLPHKQITFIQHRNLREFKYFEIERINPTHIIQLYGRLKNNSNKHNKSKKLINVGEIIIGFTTFSLNIQILLNHLDFICICFCMYFINCLFFYLFTRVNLLKRWSLLLSELKDFWAMEKPYIW